MSSALTRLQGGGQGFASSSDAFLRYAEYGTGQSRWIDTHLTAATRLANAASSVNDPDMQLALLRVAGPRLEATLVGTLLLSTWLDILNLADVSRRQHLYSEEALFADMWRWRDTELETGRMLTRSEVMDIVADRMKFYDLPMNFTPWRR